jgi:ABC-type amino acid transport substrate-binding protein
LPPSLRSICAKCWAIRRRTLTIALTPLPRDGTITPERSERVDFAEPILTAVAEIVVLGPAAPPIENFDDLAKTVVHVRRSSSYYEHLALNARRLTEGVMPVAVVEADENLEDGDLIELVDVGVIPAVIVDSHTANLWAKIFERARCVLISSSTRRARSLGRCARNRRN